MWTLFRSHHAIWLEKEFEDLKARHLREIADLKMAHAGELKRVIEDNQKLRDDLDRTRLFLNPALQSIEIRPTAEGSTLASPTLGAEYGGTPFQRIMAREMRLQEQQAAEEERKRREAAGINTVPPKGENDNAIREGRDAAPQSKPS